MRASRTSTWQAALFAVLAFSLPPVMGACGGQDLPEADGTYHEGAPLPVGQGQADGFWSDLPVMGPLPEGADLGRDFEVVFAPDEPAVTLELEMMRRVRESCGASAADRDPAGPCRIRYAVYNLRSPFLVEALADAADDGVDVQILIDAAQLDPAREWNTAHIYLSEERGFSLAMDHGVLSAEERESTDIVGIAREGLMHLKTRLFETPEWSAVLTGSMNPGDNAMLNEENLNLVRDPKIVELYAGAYEAILHDRPFANEWDQGSPINVLFTPAGSGPRAGTRILEWIREEEEQILIMVFSLRNITAAGVEGSLVDILGEKVREGVPVYVITDRKQSDGIDSEGNRIFRNDDTDERLRAAGVVVYEAMNLRTEFTAMHHKAAVLGKSRLRVITDASNWSFSGLGSRTRTSRNVESVLFVDSDALDGGRTGRRYLAQWARVLERYAHQSADEGEAPPLKEALGRLMEADDWPGHPVSFTARAEADWGETISVLGDLPRLGLWGEAHDGIALWTDEESYPYWATLEPEPLPLGSLFEWKLAAVGEDGGRRWEEGPNRVTRVIPPPLVPAPHLEAYAGWR